MSQAVDAHWPSHAPLSGLIATRHGHVPEGARQGRIEVLETAHPVPDESSMEAARRTIALASGLTEDDVVLCLMSGGGSALLALPAPGLTLHDKQQINRALLRSGASIAEINTVRKHLSGIKGGRLVRACAPARVLTLAISDVPGDDIGTIASGPTAPDPGLTPAPAPMHSTCCAAMRSTFPMPHGKAWKAARGNPPKPGDACFARSEHRVVAAPRLSLDAAAEVARAAGVAVMFLGDASPRRSARWAACRRSSQRVWRKGPRPSRGSA